MLDLVEAYAGCQEAPLLIEACFQEAHLGQPERVPQTPCVQAEGSTHQVGSRGFMDVAAHQKARVALGPLQNGLGAHMLLVSSQVERRPEGRRVAEQHVALEVGERPYLGFVPLVAKSEPTRPRTPDASHAQSGHIDHTPVAVAGQVEVAKIVVAGDPRHRNPQSLNLAEDLVHRCAVAPVALGRSATGETYIMASEVAHQQHALNANLSDVGEHDAKPGDLVMDITDDGELDARGL